MPTILWAPGRPQASASLLSSCGASCCSAQFSINKALADLGAAVFPINLDYAERLLALPFHHRDPFDRLIIAQALVEDIPVVSTDAFFDAYGIRRI
jgi:PIN domain nuclease of toxin-antitoxin system